LSSYQDEVQNELTIFSCMTKHAVGCCSDGARSGNRVSLTLTSVMMARPRDNVVKNTKW